MRANQKDPHEDDLIRVCGRAKGYQFQIFEHGEMKAILERRVRYGGRKGRRASVRLQAWARASGLRETLRSVVVEERCRADVPEHDADALPPALPHDAVDPSSVLRGRRREP